MFTHVVGIARAKAKFDAQVLAVGPASLLQPLQERRDRGFGSLVVRVTTQEHKDAPHSTRLLCMDGD